MRTLTNLADSSDHELIEILGDSRLELATRVEAARVLGARRVESAQRVLLQAKREGDTTLTKAADRALTNIFKGLLQWTQDQRQSRSEALSRSLELESEGELRERFRTESRGSVEDRIKAFEIAGLSRTAGSLPFLIQALSEDDENVVWAAAHAVIDFGSRSATRPLIRLAVTASNRSSRQAAIYALGFLRDKRAEQFLIRILKDLNEDEHTRSLAAEALGQVSRSSRSRKALLKAVHDSSVEVARSAQCGPLFVS
jgi:HEAT repeat protein